MRLKKIQLSGFKSFPDATAMDLAARMVGIVGPNGCGKSNIVDAIRWVMGETSRHIRANTLEDVIFSGTNTRKPLGRAVVELMFDNTDNSIGGAYASYTELAIKRVIARDSESKYYINNTHCRRKDIADLFFGTGLGTNSYAIIEQGMIARVVEAKPEDLRGYIEEAAGVSKYKERKRDTENRIQHTHDNLERVMDIREEVTKQLRKLKRQVKDAEKFKHIRQEKSRIEAELLLLRLRDQKREHDKYEKVMSDYRVEMEQAQAELRKYETDIEGRRETVNRTNDELHTIKETSYRLDAEITTIEQDLNSRNKNIKQIQHEQETVNATLVRNAEETSQEKVKQQELIAEQNQLNEEIERLKPKIENLQQQHSKAEAALSEISTLRDQHHSESRESFETLKVEKARTEMYEKVLAELEQNERNIDKQRQALNIEQTKTDKEVYASRLAVCQKQAADKQAEMENCTAALRDLQIQTQTFNNNLNKKHAVMRENRGQLSSLQVLQEARLGHDTDAFHQWITNAGLTDNNLVAKKIEVSDGWENAVEAVLEGFLQGIQVDSIEKQLENLSTFEKGKLVLIAPGADTVHPVGTLASVISGEIGLTGILKHIKLADNMEQATAIRNGNLQSHESVITRDGVWLGRNWVKMCKVESDEEGILTRQHKIEYLNKQIEELKNDAEKLQQDLDTTVRQTGEYEKLRDHCQTEHTDLLKEIATLESNIAHYEKLLQEQQARDIELEQAHLEIQHKHRQLLNEHQQSHKQRAKAEKQVSAFNVQHSDIEKRRTDNESVLSKVRKETDTARQILHQAEIQKESVRVAYSGSIKHSEQLQHRDQELHQRLSTLATVLDDLQKPLPEIKARKKDLLEQQFSKRQQLEQINIKTADLQTQLDQLTQQHKQSEQRSEGLRNAYEQARTDLQVNIARCNDLEKTFQDMDTTVTESELQMEMTVQNHEQALQDIQKKLEQLGAINLVALNEYNELSERREYIDSQYDDLTSALEILEKTIAKINHETKSKFKNTFEQINLHLSKIFPQMFGGGEAHLEMTENDLLKTNVTIMAKPPGKQLSSINLMSGGEKALTAAAVVFAIFKLNPSPFCVLDEVDAPLDESNVERFCEMLKAMSEQTQFIMITHNKTSMEYMDCLLGITMQEAGVSRLVSVNMEEATRLASA